MSRPTDGTFTRLAILAAVSALLFAVISGFLRGSNVTHSPIAAISSNEKAAPDNHLDNGGANGAVSVSTSAASTRPSNSAETEAGRFPNAELSQASLPLPDDLAAELREPNPELPDDMKAQLSAPAPALPDDLQAQLQAHSQPLPLDTQEDLDQVSHDLTASEDAGDSRAN